MKQFESDSYIESQCNKFNITNWTKNPDGTIDVEGNVNLSEKGLDKLPLKFGKVSGDFNCSNNQLFTLEGSPREVGGSFYCRVNKLTTLEGAPEEVGGNFMCSHNELTSLVGSPKIVVGGFCCQSNKLITLEGAPKEIGFGFNIPGSGFHGHFRCDFNPIFEVYRIFPSRESFMDSLDYGYLSGNNIIKWRFEQALHELNILQEQNQQLPIQTPLSIIGWRYIKDSHDENKTRETFIFNEDILNKIKAIAYWDKSLVNDLVNTAMDAYITKYENEKGAIDVSPILYQFQPLDYIPINFDEVD
jgi:hypothetical protein